MSPTTSSFEHSLYIGNYMGAILYGFELTLYFLILRGLFQRGNKNSPKSRRFCTIYSTVMVLLSTINLSCNAVWGEEMWITHREDPGGVQGYINTQVSVWYETLASSAVITCVFMGDALLLYRLFVVYSKSFAVVAVPLVAYITAFALAIVQVVMSGEPNGNFFGVDVVKIAVSYYTITISMNIVLTILICIRLIRMSKYISNVLGEEAASVYTSAAAILVESAAFYSAAGIMYLIPYGLQIDLCILFGQLWTKMSVISPLLIILRVVNGRAWRDNVAVTTRTPMEFATASIGATSSTIDY
ncbi:hypothetical protein BYT27DRAFT_7079105 [Phlegmacium glaucopus]|nr:hypothetical protein BYT27DRAFT_7079105 [Phlegmacium glaucopus]